MRVLLVYPNQPAVATQPPLGLMYIASYLEKQWRHPWDYVKIIEGNTRMIREQLGKSPPSFYDFIGITCMTSMYHEIIKMRDFFHQWDVPLVFGGVHATILPESLLTKEHHGDIVIQGEGEISMAKIVNGEISSSQDRILQGEAVQNLDELPFPARYLVNKRYLRHSVSMMAARGCPFNCSFCQPTLRKVFGSKVRRRAVGNVIQEMRNCQHNYGVNDFEFFDDTFTVDKDWIYNFCIRLKYECARDGFSWKALSRVDMLDYDMLRTMKQAGLTKLSLGIESGSQEILNAYSKGTTVEQNNQVLKWCEQLGIKVHGFFMIGALEETEQTIQQTRDFIRAHKFDTIFVTVTTPTPCTRLYNRVEREGRLKVSWKEFDLLGSLTTTVHPKNLDQVVPMSLYHLEASQILKAKYEILREFYMKKLKDPGYLLRFIKNNSLKYSWEAAKNVFR